MMAHIKVWCISTRRFQSPSRIDKFTCGDLRYSFPFHAVMRVLGETSEREISIAPGCSLALKEEGLYLRLARMYVLFIFSFVAQKYAFFTFNP